MAAHRTRVAATTAATAAGALVLLLAAGTPSLAQDLAISRLEHHIFQVMLDDLEDGRLENRSSSFSAPSTVSR